MKPIGSETGRAIAKEFRKARKKLKIANNYGMRRKGICHALGYKTYAACVARKIVIERMGGVGYLESWVSINVLNGRAPDPKDMFDYRQRWLKALEKEFNEK